MERQRTLSVLAGLHVLEERLPHQAGRCHVERGAGEAIGLCGTRPVLDLRHAQADIQKLAHTL